MGGMQLHTVESFVPDVINDLSQAQDNAGYFFCGQAPRSLRIEGRGDIRWAGTGVLRAELRHKLALRGGPVHVGVVVRRIMTDLARRRIDPDYLEGHHG